MIEWINTGMMVFVLGMLFKNTQAIGKLCGLVEKKE